MESSDPARVLVVAHKTAATPALLEAVRERAARGPARFHLLVPNPQHPSGRPAEAAPPGGGRACAHGGGAGGGRSRAGPVPPPRPQSPAPELAPGRGGAPGRERG